MKIAVFLFAAIAAAHAGAFEEYRVVPDAIESVPSTILEVTYENNNEVQPGNVLTPTMVKNQPSVKWDADAESFYILMLIDLDATNGKKTMEWHHWIVGNIPGSDVSKGDVLAGYMGAAPPQGTGLHRYVFLLYKQPSKLTFDEKRVTKYSGKNRDKPTIEELAEKYELGSPVAANFFRAEYDDYVPEVYKQLQEN